MGLARANDTQSFEDEAFGLFEDTLIPDGQRIFACCAKGGKTRIRLLRKELGNQRGGPARRAQEVGEAFRAGGGMTGRGEIAPEFAEEQAVGTVALAEDGSEGSTKVWTRRRSR